MNKPLRALAAAACLLLLSACATAPAGQDAQPGGAGPVLEVVASTSVYADVARAVGGSAVSVRAIVDKTSQDPHSYEATARDKLAVSKADVVIANGGGYDPFMDALAQGLSLPDGAMIHAADFQAGHGDAAGATEAAAQDHTGHDHAEGNEHVWYDVHTVGALARGLAAEYSKLMPGKSAAFTAAADAFDKRIDELAGRIDALRATAEGKKFAMTEPLAYYLLSDAGMVDGTPAGVSAAMEAGEDVPPLLLKKLAEGLESHEFAVLALNTQTSGPQTEKVGALAVSAGVPVLDLTETLPEGQDYITWMESNVQQLEVALGR
ncbi:ABC transporter substrate-binding protein [Arthrobacter sp. AQ5-05]|uniref:metal ABC transporter solute-binding protein, Zn/Mn family n=1 Tax=Arthrobacter sp. AQ5-05 TaxID=2184581 RepID=UPI000DCB4BB9|nr:zinc ABC transporter substrate-binding protein [Arthrobacter sp. AQ5-05]RAX50071.1 ABC transporter substrate-binding protein [Arthrobacter sp. AQ5-05]